MRAPRRWGRLPAIEDLGDLTELTLRYTQTRDGAPARCRFRECRDGRCHLRITENGGTVCAAGIESEAIYDMGRLIDYLIEVFSYYFPSKPA